MPKWTNEQLTAIKASGNNIIVSAGAGSGKTAVLTERVIEKLKSGIKINELLILTFTNAAAGEMKERIRNKINEHDELLENLDYIDSAYITTFDSFALSLVKKYNYVLNVSSNLNIVDASIIDIIKNDLLDEVFDELYLENNPKFLKLINDFCIKNDTSIKKSILKINSLLDLKSNKIEYLNNYIEDNYNDTKIIEYINKYFELIKNEIINIENNLIMISESDYYDYYEELNILLDKLLKSKSYDEIFLNINVNLPKRPRNSEDIKEFKDNIDASIKIIKGYLRFNNEEEIKESFSIMKEYIEIIIKIIIRLSNKIKDYKFKEDLYEFTDIELMAIKLLKENENIREEIKYFYKEICVDEYQDTNDLQEDFIKLIENNNVYMVGDIKQSIYGFRNANPKIFKNKYDKYSNNDGGIKIDLLKNFRSRSNVLSGINEIFNLIMDDDLGGANYIESHQMVFGNNSYEENKNDNQDYDLELYNYKYDDKEYKKEEIEAFIIGKDIKDKINNNYEVLDKYTNKLRKCRYDDFCIIMDRGISFPTYNKIFEYLGIPLQIYEDKKLTSEIDLLLINNILGFILKINQNIKDVEFKYYFMSIARSHLFMYDDNEIFNILKDKDIENTDIYNISKSISDKISKLSCYELIKEIIDEFSFYENSIKVGNVEDTIIRINNIYDIAKNIGNMGYTPFMFKEYLNKMIESKNEIKYKGNVNSDNAVKIMNIHKSKGLEYPVCYFSGYYKEFNTMDIKDRFIYDNEYGIITPFFKDGIGTSILKDLVKDNYIKSNISEQIRLFYVALTRAKEKMIIVSNIDDFGLEKNKIVDINVRKKYNSFLNIIKSISGNLKKYVKNINLEDINITKKYLYNIKEKNNTNIDIDKKIIYKKINVENIEEQEKHASKEINKLITQEENKLLEYGTKMHKIFEETNFLDIINEEYKNVIENFVEKLGVNNDTLIYKEHEFIYKENNINYHGIIDLILIENDVIKIIDYKLKNINDEKYVEQLKVYYKYIKSISNKNIKMYLYSIIDEELKEVCINE